MKKDYPRYGLWEVTTEGDVEGRSTRHLGTHRGNFDEIAALLADKVCYSLRFKLVEPLSLKVDRQPLRSVHISFDPESKQWSMSSAPLEDYVRSLLPHDGPMIVKSGTYHASVLLVPRVPPTPEERAKYETIKRLGLTDQDLKNLGVET